MNSVLEKICESFKSGLKKTAISMVLDAESRLPGATGAEKRAYVAQKIDDIIVLPWYLESFDGPAAGLLVDFICNKLNLLTDHDKSAVADADVEKLSTVIEATDEDLTSASGTVDEKLEAIYQKYTAKK